MILKSDGHIVHGLGYVALYAAYMEEAIEECVELFKHKDDKAPKSLDQWPISKKLGYIHERIVLLGKLPPELATFPNLISYCDDLLKRRNEVIHGRIYGKYQGENDELRPSRKTGLLREINADELYELAQQLFDMLTPLNTASFYSLRRVL